MRQWWLNLSISKKLYVVVGVMATLIAAELITLLFAMNTLSAIRAFVGGESFWSKSQKNAIYNIQRYVTTQDEKHFAAFEKNLEVSLGDKRARVELEKPYPDYEIIRDGFIQGQNHPDDIKKVVELITRFRSNRYIDQAMVLWEEADRLFAQLILTGYEIHNLVNTGRAQSAQTRAALARVDQLNLELTQVEYQFSHVLGDGSRWMENTVTSVLVLVTFIVGMLCLGLTVAMSRNMNRSIYEINQMANEVGKGNFDFSIPVHSHDELGILAQAINKMSLNLKNAAGEKAVAESASQSKTLYLASVSHEIRTPLGVIIGLAEVLKDPTLSNPERLKFIETIEKTGKNLTRIINDILDVSKVESGHVDIEKSKFSLSELMNEISAMMSLKAEKEHNTFIITKQGDFADRICTDRIRLQQILVNLISNSLKFTKNGIVTLTYRLDQSKLFFEVKDTGTGVAPENREQIFQAFKQEATGNDKQEGTGLGLSIAKRLSNALGGDLILKESERGKGSTFLASISYEPAEEPAVAFAPKPQLQPQTQLQEPAQSETARGTLSGKKVLVVEDVIDNQMLTKLYLARKGMKVQFANNGLEGLTKALDENYDVILMDMQMPVMDGYTATRELREKGYQKPIIAVTAHAMKEDREKCLQAGCDDYITKPLDSGVLYRTIEKSLNL